MRRYEACLCWFLFILLLVVLIASPGKADLIQVWVGAMPKAGATMSWYMQLSPYDTVGAQPVSIDSLRGERAVPCPVELGGAKHLCWELNAVWYVVTMIQTSITPPVDSIEAPVTLSISAYPNPFDKALYVKLDLLKAAHVSIVIYDVLGREMVRILDRDCIKGEHKIVWSPNRYIAPGVYFCYIRVGKQLTVRKIIKY